MTRFHYVVLSERVASRICMMQAPGAPWWATLGSMTEAEHLDGCGAPYLRAFSSMEVLL